MAVLTAQQINDLITGTQNDLGRLKITDISYALQEYVAMPKLLRKEKVEFEGSPAIQWNVNVTTSGAARNVGLYGTDDVNVDDTLQTASVPWRHTTTNYAIERRELAMNKGKYKIVELVKVRRRNAMTDLAVQFENDFWSKPTDSTDTLKPFGIDYWCVASQTAGFNGTNPSGFTSGAGGLSSSTYTRWANYTDGYTSVTKDDLIAKWRKAATLTNFKSPVGDEGPDEYNTGNRYGYYMNYAVLGVLERALENQNDNLGNDIASKDGKALFRGNPCTYVPQLDSNSKNPVYGINWGVFSPVVLSGEFMREEAMAPLSNQHTVFVTHIDTTYNYKCWDRRRLFRIDLP